MLSKKAGWLAETRKDIEKEKSIIREFLAEYKTSCERMVEKILIRMNAERKRLEYYEDNCERLKEEIEYLKSINQEIGTQFKANLSISKANHSVIRSNISSDCMSGVDDKENEISEARKVNRKDRRIDPPKPIHCESTRVNSARTRRFGVDSEHTERLSVIEEKCLDNFI